MQNIREKVKEGLKKQATKNGKSTHTHKYANKLWIEPTSVFVCVFMCKSINIFDHRDKKYNKLILCSMSITRAFD